MDVRIQLQKLGFSEKEVRVYLAMLALGSAVASDIAKKAGIKRSTTYVILDALAERGLVSVIDRRNIKLYTAAPAEQLVQHLQNMAKRYGGMADAAKDLLPALKASRLEQTPEPKIRFFEGSDGIKSVYEDTLASLEEIRVHASFQNLAPTKQTVHRKHGRPDIKVESIVLDTPRDRKRIAPDKADLRKILLTSRGQDSAPSEMNIYDDRVVFISPAENFALIAESHELASALKKMCNTPSAQAEDSEKRAAHLRKTGSSPRVLPDDFNLVFG